jgi:acyl carrier protein
MDFKESLKQINNIFIEILGNASIVLARETTANDIDEWDSLTHIQLIATIEKEFSVRFSTKEIRSFKNIGDMCDCIMNKGK